MLPLELEELSLSEWPALETQYLDGWILRFSRGYTKRSNSVSPLYGSMTDPMELVTKVQTCEDLYRLRGLPVIFKLTGASAPPLDSLLEERGYTLVDPSLVMTRDLSPMGSEPRAAEPSPAVEILPGDHPDWLEWASRGKGLSPADAETFKVLSSRGSGKSFHVWLRDPNGTPVSGATGVVNRGWMGILNVFTPEAHRRRGFAKKVMEGALATGPSWGANKTYLAVIRSNTAARNLYESLGFTPLYDYWYRVKK